MFDQLLAASKRADRAAFDRQLVLPASAFADRLFANLAALPTGSVRFSVQPAIAALSADEPDSLRGGWAQEVRVSSQLRHDTGPSTYEVWFALAPGRHGVRLVGLAADDVADATPLSRPLWLTQRIGVSTGPDATVVAAGDRTDLPGWLRRAEAAERAVDSRIGSGRAGRETASRARWSRGLVIELPSTGTAFDQVLGVEPGSYDQIAAVAWPEGPDPSTAAVRVVVNPTLADSLDSARLDVLITHEATHVLTRSATSPAPMWLVEGFADWVAFDRVPAAAPPTVELVLTDVRRNGAPASLPADTDFAPDAPNLNLTYGRAWLLCRFIAETWSDRRLVRLYAKVDRGTALSAALRDFLDIDEPALLSRWQRWLRSQARR